jgi:hypothetical protein
MAIMESLRREASKRAQDAFSLIETDGCHRDHRSRIGLDRSGI